MPIRKQFLDLMRQQERALGSAWAGLADQLALIIQRYADRDGTIPLSRWRQLRQELADAIARFVLARPEQAAFRVLSGGTVLPLSTFMSILWSTLQDSVRLGVQQQNEFLTAHVTNEIQGQLRRAFLDPFARLDDLPPSEAAVLRKYVHPLEALRSDGLQIAQRLPVAVADMQRRSTALLNTLLSEQTSASEIATAFRQYYDGKLTRFGSWGIRAGERLLKIARSEPIYAFSLASQAAAGTNPYLDTQVYVRRGRNVPCRICDGVVAGNPYTLENVILPGYHASCFCYIEFRNRTVPQWDYAVDQRWLQTMGALSPAFAERLLRLN